MTSAAQHDLLALMRVRCSCNISTKWLKRRGDAAASIYQPQSINQSTAINQSTTQFHSSRYRFVCVRKIFGFLFAMRQSNL
jgi:hypothetical protein